VAEIEIEGVEVISSRKNSIGMAAATIVLHNKNHLGGTLEKPLHSH